MIDGRTLEERLANTEKQLELACGEIIECRELELRRRKMRALEREQDALEIQHLQQQQADLTVEAVFWKAAAERALRLWEAEAKRRDGVLDAVETALGSASTALSKANWDLLEALFDEE